MDQQFGGWRVGDAGFPHKAIPVQTRGQIGRQEEAGGKGNGKGKAEGKGKGKGKKAEGQGVGRVVSVYAAGLKDPKKGFFEKDLGLREEGWVDSSSYASGFAVS